MPYYAHHYSWDKNVRDQSSFNPDYPMEPIETFEPMVCEVLSRKAYDPEIIKNMKIVWKVLLLLIYFLYFSGPLQQCVRTAQEIVDCIRFFANTGQATRKSV